MFHLKLTFNIKNMKIKDKIKNKIKINCFYFYFVFGFFLKFIQVDIRMYKQKKKKLLSLRMNKLIVLPSTICKHPKYNHLQFDPPRETSIKQSLVFPFSTLFFFFFLGVFLYPDFSTIAGIHFQDKKTFHSDREFFSHSLHSLSMLPLPFLQLPRNFHKMRRNDSLSSFLFFFTLLQPTCFFCITIFAKLCQHRRDDNFSGIKIKMIKYATRKIWISLNLWNVMTI